ncbi:MAG: AMP-binding protein [Burkholderiales bacterium]
MRHDLVTGLPTECEPAWVDAEHPLFILYTSGLTGKPKGVQHDRRLPVAGGVLDEVDLRHQGFRRLLVHAADVGWVTGHSRCRLYGPLAVGATQVMFEGVPTYPSASRFWEMIQRHKVTIFYTAPTAIRSLIKAGGDLPKKFDLSSLRLLGSVGEPINLRRGRGTTRPSAVRGARSSTPGGRPRPARMISPMPGATPPSAGLVHEAAARHPGGDRRRDRPRRRARQGGFLVIKRPWPSMIRTIWGDSERFKKSYYPEDLGAALPRRRRREPRSRRLLLIMGRIDDVLNVGPPAGHDGSSRRWSPTRTWPRPRSSVVRTT